MNEIDHRSSAAPIGAALAAGALAAHALPALSGLSRDDGRPVLPAVRRALGVEDRTAAEELRGQELTVPEQELPALGEGEWCAHELVGCVVRDGEHEVGVVSGLLELPSCEVLEVRRSDAPGTLLVPLVKDAIRSVAPERREIDIDLGFLEDAPPGGSQPHRPHEDVGRG